MVGVLETFNPVIFYVNKVCYLVCSVWKHYTIVLEQGWLASTFI